jgi:DNA repair exonuclease SbcCD ATPase subunit
MLTIKYMMWNNCFSYGDKQEIRFDENPLTQLMGANGSGKTSISMMIQEVLYGKNIKNIKKQDIANNKSGKKGYDIVLFFDKDGDEYSVVLERKSNLKFRLFKNGSDISSHTSLDTYKTLANIIGIPDFKVFCQLIYQHSTDSLDFLTATDTNRKKFLISLLQLDRYLEMHEHFKAIVRDVNVDITSLVGSVNTIESWINKHKDMDFIKQKYHLMPIIPDILISDIAKLKENISNITFINRKIATNNEYIIQLGALNSKYYLNSAPQVPSPSSQELRAERGVLNSKYIDRQSRIDKLNNLENQCHACLQEIDEDIKTNMLDTEVYLRDKTVVNISKIVAILPDILSKESEIARYKKEKIEFERLNQLIDRTLAAQTLDKDDMEKELYIKSASLNSLQKSISEVEEANRKIAAHNSKVDVVKEQLDTMKKDLLDKNISLMEKENLAHVLELLKKTFSTNGLVSYKIESSVKELEKKINTYLSELTHFQIYFKLSGEKLNIEVVDDLGNITSISNLSSGERARVNIATILAIRSILSSLTSTKINLLFLDEVIGVIDAEGKEKLSEILLKENLNTFIVSHDWSHPLIPRLNIVKEHHISRIDYD